MSQKNTGGGLFKTVWDERQQQAYAQINSKAFNLAWILLLLSFLAQVIAFPREPGRWLGEMILFILLNIFILMAYIRAGLWTKNRQQPGIRQNLLASLLAAVVLAIVSLVRMAVTGQLADNPWPGIRFVLFQSAGIFVVAFGLLTLISRIHQKKQKQAEEAMNEEENR